MSVKEYTFSGIDKTNYAALYNFISGKKIRIKNIEGVGNDEQPSRGAPLYDERDDAGDDDEESSEDEDYDQANASKSSSSSEDIDSDDMGSVISDDSDLAEHRKKAGLSEKKTEKSEKKSDKKSEKSDKTKKSKDSEESSSKKRKSDTGKSSKDEKATPKKKAKKDPNAPKVCTCLFPFFYPSSRSSKQPLSRLLSFPSWC